MRKLWMKALFVALAASLAGAQPSTPSAQQVDAQPERVKVYSAGPGVTAPELLPLNMAPPVAGKCKKKADGIVMLSVIVDATGRPRNLMFFHPVGTDLDKFALQIAAADRFKPGTSEGAPVAVAQLLEVNMQGCVEQTKDDTGKKMYLLRLRSQPQQKLEQQPQPPEEAVLTTAKPRMDYGDSTPRTAHVGGSVKAPVPLISPEAIFTDAARKAKYQGICLISLVVDANGMPQNLIVKKKLDYGLDENALAAVSRYRFKPAIRDGVEPVPVMIAVEVNFQLY
jgi:TonB family protein